MTKDHKSSDITSNIFSIINMNNIYSINYILSSNTNSIMNIYVEQIIDQKVNFTVNLVVNLVVYSKFNEGD